MSPSARMRSGDAVSAGASRSQTALVIHPVTGEVLGTGRTLEAVGDEDVAEVWIALKAREKELRDMRRIVETELARRCDIRGRPRVLMGNFEVTSKPRRESVWDAEEVERVVRELLDRGVLEARVVTDLIKHETTVSRSNAQSVVDRLSGEDRRALEACRTWQVRGHGVEVVRSIELLP